jgi:thiamine-monophosphate kinase
MLGDALAGFESIEAGFDPPPALAAAYNRPVPRIDDGKALAPNVTAMMDVSDGLLIDAERIATASGVAIEIDLAKIPLSDDYRACRGENRDSRLQAASWGDDYQLLFTISADIALPVAATIIGRVGEGSGISLLDAGAALPLPPSLGYQHH